MFRIIAFLLLFNFIFCYGQTEKKIIESHFPESALDYLRKEYPSAKHLKYFVDSKGDSNIYIANFKVNSQILSVEFFESGKLFEVEKEVLFSSLPTSCKDTITKYLKSKFHHFKIRKVEFVNPDMKTEYELFVRTKENQGPRFLEIFFDEHGRHLRTEEPILKPIPSLF